MNSNDTIVAIATPPGRGGVGIIRVSGNVCQTIAKKVLGQIPVPRQANFTAFKGKEGEILDQGIALFFQAPNSFTGEDVLELQAHGGPIILDLILQRCLELGARVARPGEFSERAFLNDKLDLAQAEAIADLIDASSEQAARAAVRSLQGDFSVRVNSLLKSLIDLRMYIEAAIDFPEEEIDFLSDKKLTVKFDQLQTDFSRLKESTRQGTLLHEGISVVIAGRPNAGKSSLLNVLAAKDSAIVTDVAGTTRDVLREQIQINGLPLHVIDTAGLRQTDDPVELMGINRAWTEIEKADRVLLLIDDRQGITAEDQQILDQLPKGLALTIIRNKCDLSGAVAAIINEEPTVIRMSVREHTGVDILKTHLQACVGFQSNGEGEFIARRRHLDALTRTGHYIDQAREQLSVAMAGELAAEELREAQQHLAEITGEFSSDDLLGTIFSSFCIGK